MEIDKCSVSSMVVSHGHYDHCSGGPWLLDNRRISCYSEMTRERYAAMLFLGITKNLDVHDAAPNYISDEDVLIYKSGKGLIIITGCGHRGIVNIVRHCQNVTSINLIYALVGGFHRCCVSPSLSGESGTFCTNRNRKKLCGCRCTGAWGLLLGPELTAPATGDVLCF